MASGGFAREATVAEWRRLMEAFARSLAASARVREDGGSPQDPHPVDERLVRVIWHEQMMRAADMATASGKRIEVLEPGRWNTGRGPDFLDARVRLAGEEFSGDVEIHVDSADWRRHGHHQDFTYNRVVLHVALHAHDDRPYEEKQNGERLERLVVSQCVEPDLDTLRRTISLDEYPMAQAAETGVCHEEFMRLPEPQLLDFLRAAGKARIEDKIGRLEVQAVGVGSEQLLYQAIMVAQGYKANKTLYFLLAKRAPLAELRELARDVAPEERTTFYLSVLLHVAQLFPAQADALAGTDGETQDLVARMQRHWAIARPYLSDRILPPTKRWFAGMRPPGFPPRRLAAVAVLLGRIADPREPLIATMRAKVLGASPVGLKPAALSRLWLSLVEPLVVDDEAHYFARHFTLGGRPQRPQALLGEPAARSLFFNALLPLLILEARRSGDAALAEAAWTLAARFPALEDNAVIRFMQRRLFGEGSDRAAWFRVELFQQALYKVFSDCCAHNERSCGDCVLLAMGRAAG
jgi:hypothetical protein